MPYILHSKTTIMPKRLSYLVAILIIQSLSIAAFAQTTTISGNVSNSNTREALSAVSVAVKGTNVGTVTDDKGNFKLTVKQSPPFTLVITSAEYSMQEVTVTSSSQTLNISLVPGSTMGQEVVISATRTPSRILEAPVTIERISAANIRNSASPTVFDMVGNLKEVDMVTASMTFKTPSTRGFNGSGNLRLNQNVDGMDNQAPGLNFSLGAVVGPTDLDVESVELLPGASSALYGPGGMNGSLIVTTKDPFKYQGLSFQTKTGMMHVDQRERPVAPFYNWSVRWAKKVSEKFAFKIGGEVIQAKDWIADDYRDYNRVGTTGSVKVGTRETDPNFDGVNIYGDETTIDLKSNVLNPLAAAAPFYAPYIAALPSVVPVSRTGYMEKDVVNPNTVNLKLSASLNYKITDKLTFVIAGHRGSGNTVYTGSDRYSLKNLKMAQYKAELNHINWFLRYYTTREDAGESFNSTITTRLFNEAWKPSGGSTGWYSQYGQAFLLNKLSGATDIVAHNAARAFADIGRPTPGSTQFRQIFDKVRSVPIKFGGGLFLDKTNLSNWEGQYNFSEYTKDFAEIIVGANYKKYLLNSEGTLFADSAGKIGINEVGVYTQITKKFLDDKLKLIGSVRYDKNENFAGKFTPRISAVIRVAEDNNIRLSYQTAYRFPSTQQQWIHLKVGSNVYLVGGDESFRTKYNFAGNKVYSVDANLYSSARTEKIFPAFKPESVSSFEGGYKGLLLDKKLLIDLYGYFGIYKDFIARTLVAQAVNGNPATFDLPTGPANLADASKVTVFSVPTNVSGDVNSYGFGGSLNYSFPHNFYAELMGSLDKLKNIPAGFIAAFNAPDGRVGGSVGNTGFWYQNRVGFNVAWRWQGELNYEGDFANGLVDAYHTLDAQVSYKFPKQKILCKLGGTNILNQYYRNGFGNATVGGLYYFAIGYNLF